jgi:1-deoxy-D-xylulose-5-phosphate synthase
MLRTESEHDCYGAGHAGTALSAALGMAVARDLSGGSEHVIAVAGDAAFTNGISFEALNNIGEHTKRLIVVLNDNEWSIDRNVGAIARYFHKIVTNEHYQHLHESAKRIVRRSAARPPSRWRDARKRRPRACCGLRFCLRSSAWKYFGPIDGHNLPLLVETFKFLKAADHPVLLHVLTQKGRGYQPALDGRRNFTAWAPTIRRPARPSPPGCPPTLRYSPTRWWNWPTRTSALWPSPRPCPTAPGSIFSGRIIPSATSTWASPKSMRWCLPPAWPRADYRPVCAIYSTFLQRAFDPIVHDVALQKLPVRLLHGPRRAFRRRRPHAPRPVRHRLSARHSGDGADGAQGRRRTGRHDEDRARAERGPSAIRYPRGVVVGVARKAEPQVLPVGKAEVLKDGSDVAILGLGPMTALAREAAAQSWTAPATRPRSSIRALSSRIDREMLELYARRVAAALSPLKIT